MQPGFYQRYTPPPPGSQEFGLEQGARSYFPAAQNRFDGQYAAANPQYPIDFFQYAAANQYAAVDPQYAADLQYPVLDQDAAAAVTFDDYTHNNTELYQQVEGYG
jgi:hypothetical protein